MVQLRIVLFILFLTTIGQLGVDIYLPSLPTMVHELNTTATAIQLSLTAFLLGFAVSQLIYGPLADRHGRKPILLIGLSIFFIGSVLCSMATNIELFSTARIIQGLGAGSASMMSRAISRDVFYGKQLAKMSAYVAMSWAVVPIVAPLIGSYIQTYLGWRYNFIFLSVATGFFILLVLLMLPETHKSPSHASSSFSKYKTLLSTQIFLKYTLSVMVMTGVFVAFNISGPFLLQNVFNQSVVAYGWWIVFVASGYMIGSFSSSRLLDHFSSEQIMKLGMKGFLVFSLFMALLAFANLNTVYAIVIPMFLIFTSVGLIYPQCIAGSLSPFPHMAGSAGALFGFMAFSGSSIASFVVSHLHESNAVPLSIVLVIQSMLVFLINKKL